MRGVEPTAPLLRIIALYSNVLEDPGVIASKDLGNSQLDFLKAALTRAKKFAGALVLAHQKQLRIEYPQTAMRRKRPMTWSQSTSRRASSSRRKRETFDPSPRCAIDLNYGRHPGSWPSVAAMSPESFSGLSFGA